MASSLRALPELRKLLTSEVVEDVQHFWFDHIQDDAALILPGQSEMRRWFTRDAEFDKACVAQFQPALTAIIESGASTTDILNSIDQSSPLAWLSVIILLDQISRNCFRGAESATVFTKFDPLAEEISLRAIESGIVTRTSQLRYRLSYRFWFHLPLMHSENLAMQERAIELHEDTARDIEELLSRDASTLTGDERKCHQILSSQREALMGFLSNDLDFKKRHKAIIERFGRYPHRNQALGRQSTPEEVEYLEKGGETFG